MCPAHHQDRHFCSPIVDNEGEAARLKQEAMAKEIEKVKKEYEEKQQRKKEREKQSAKNDKDKEKDADKDDVSKNEDTNSKASDEKERDEKVQSNAVQLLYLPFYSSLFWLDRFDSKRRHKYQAR